MIGHNFRLVDVMPFIMSNLGVLALPQNLAG